MAVSSISPTGMSAALRALDNTPASMFDCVQSANTCQRFFTPPTIISKTIAQTNPGISTALGCGLTAFDNIPSVTAFLPSDSALVAALKGSCSLSAANAKALLDNHVIVGEVVYSPSIVDGAFFKTVAGKDITISIINGVKYVNGAKVLRQDIATTNGVIHIIDKVRHLEEYLDAVS